MFVLATTLLIAPFAGQFSMHRANDSSTGTVAYRYLLPKGWSAQDKVTWTLENRARPMSFASTLASPDGKTTISILPTETMTFQVQNGKLSGTLPPETATKALDNVLAVNHPELKNANLIVRKDFDVPTPLDGQGLKTKGMVGILEVSFQQNGQQMTELLSSTEWEGSHQGDNGLVQGVWMMSAGYTLTCTGQISEEAFKTFATVVASHRADPTFFAVTMAVSKQQQTGPVDLKAVAERVKDLDADGRTSYLQNLTFHGQSVAKIFPIYPGLTEVVTYDGPMTSFKGTHVWMKKPGDYAVTDGATSPGVGWDPAKDVG